MAAIKKTVFSILERGAQDSQQNWVSKLINYIILILIFLNVFAVIIQTEKNIAIEYNAFFSTLEYISVTVFSTEYLLRVWVSTEYKAYKQPIWGRLKYMISPMAIIDLFAILPFYLLLITKLDFRFIATFRFFRLLRIFKLKRYSHALNTLWQVIVDKKEELTINFVTILVLLIISSSLMYYIEHPYQPQLFSSIPATMWWSVSTLTTVGYGDMVPITPFGKLLSACIAMLGIAMFALPAALLSSGFTEHIKVERRKKMKYNCPHCQQKIDGTELFND